MAIMAVNTYPNGKAFDVSSERNKELIVGFIINRVVIIINILS